MASTLPWIPALPLLSSALLLIAGSRLSPRWVAAFGVGSVGLAALVGAHHHTRALRRRAGDAIAERAATSEEGGND